MQHTNGFRGDMLKKILCIVVVLTLTSYGSVVLWNKLNTPSALHVERVDIVTEKFNQGDGSVAEQISVYGENILGEAEPLIGFILGITYRPATNNYNRTIKFVSDLKPRFWRLSNHNNNIYGFISEGNFVTDFGTELMFVMQDAMHVKYGYNLKISPECQSRESTCFKSFLEFKEAWVEVSTAVMNEIVQKKYPVTYFEVFGEPINAGFNKENSGTGITGITPEQLSDLFKTTHDIIRVSKPSAKIGGPSWIGFNKIVLSDFLNFVADQGLSLDFISWHEFGSPHEVVEHVAEVRKMFMENPVLCAEKCPEIHITEFSSSEHAHIPATGVLWFYYLEKAKVDWASRACWNVVRSGGEQGDTCWSTIDGMFMEDNETTTDMYWVYKLYADMDGVRLQTDITSPRTVAISDRNDSKKELAVLVGRYSYNDVDGNVKIVIKDYPYGDGTVYAEIFKVPAEGVLYTQKELVSPIRIETQVLNVVNGATEVDIGLFEDGEVYKVLLKRE